jgi:hypothetical protein
MPNAILPPKAERREEEYKKNKRNNALSLHALSKYLHRLLTPL